MFGIPILRNRDLGIANLVRRNIAADSIFDRPQFTDPTRSANIWKPKSGQMVPCSLTVASAASVTN